MKNRVKLTAKLVREAQAQGRDYQIFDEEVRAFSVRVYASGRKAFTFDYRFAGVPRRFTIGPYPEWSVEAARARAKELRCSIDAGIDPLAEKEARREAPRIKDLIDQYIEHHIPTLSPRNGADQVSMLRKLVEPEWGKRMVTEITEEDVAALLTKIAAGRARPSKPGAKSRRRDLQPARPTPVRANRVGEVIRKMFNLAIKPWKMRADNPAEGFYRRTENERETFLSAKQIERLADALCAAENRVMADVVLLCMLSGARLAEARTATFSQFDLAAGIWTKPASTTKQRKTHRVPISEELAALVRLRRLAVPEGVDYLFPSERLEDGRPVQDLRRFWHSIREAAGVDVRFHDLRHTFASVLASRGASLQIIGKLLGHSSMQTTRRYAHLTEDALRENVALMGQLVVRPKLRVVGGGN